MGLLVAAQQAPRVVLSLHLGVLVGAHSKLTIMRLCQAGRALSLITIPLAYWLGGLTMAQLYVVGILNGIMSLAYSYADRSLLPKVVARDELLAANARMRTTSTIASSAVPGLGGALIQIVAAPLVIAFDAISYVISFFLLKSVKADATPASEQSRKSAWAVIREGAEFVAKEPTLRALTLSSIFATAGASMFAAVQLLFFLRTLSFEPANIGLIMSVAGIASVAGALLCGSLTRRLGPGWAIIISTGLPGLGYLATAATPANGLALPLVLAFQAVVGLCGPIYAINEVTLRQTLSSDALLPTISSFRSFIAGSAGPVGAILGGVLAERLGLRAVLEVASITFMAAMIPLFYLPRRSQEAVEVS